MNRDLQFGTSLYPKLNVQVFLDGANQEQILKRYHEGFVAGFTTNPSLVAKAGVKDYLTFAKGLLSSIKDKSVSFEVFADHNAEMEREALILGALAPNVHVKIPITNTKQESTLPLLKKLLTRGMKLNVTALFTIEQVKGLSEVVGPNDDVLVSVFAGRLADTGRDPIPLMKETVELYRNRPNAKVLWASTREAWNIYEADRVGCDIITAPDALIEALKMHQKTPEDYSLDTVKAFFKDSTAANLKIEG